MESKSEKEEELFSNFVSFITNLSIIRKLYLKNISRFTVSNKTKD